MFGVALQVLSIISEALRLTLVQLLLQRKGITMNPVSTMFYVSPGACLRAHELGRVV